jgi:hypothetical protein
MVQTYRGIMATIRHRVLRRSWPPKSLLLHKNALALLNQGAAMQMAELGQISRVSTPTPLPILIPTSSSPSYDPNPTDQQAAGQDSYHVDTLDDAESTSDTQSRHSTPALQGLQELAKNIKPRGPVRTHAKRDFTKTEISCLVFIRCFSRQRQNPSPPCSG